MRTLVIEVFRRRTFHAELFPVCTFRESGTFSVKRKVAGL